MVRELQVQDHGIGFISCPRTQIERAEAKRVLPHLLHAGGPQLRGATKMKNVQKIFFCKFPKKYFFIYFFLFSLKNPHLRPLEKIRRKTGFWSKKVNVTISSFRLRSFGGYLGGLVSFYV